MKKLFVVTAFSLLATASIAQAACITTGDGKVYCGELVIKY